jgi:hypothetical protein
MNCVICNEKILPNDTGWSRGNNAQPVANGQCCDNCDQQVVLPARLTELGYEAIRGAQL